MDPSPVCGVWSSVWLPDAVPAYAPDEPPEDVPPEEELPEDALTEEPPEDALPEEVPPEDALPEEVPPEDTLPDVPFDEEPPEDVPAEPPLLEPEEEPPTSTVTPSASFPPDWLLPELDEPSLTSTLVLPGEDDSDVSLSSLLLEELPPSRLENT